MQLVPDDVREIEQLEAEYPDRRYLRDDETDLVDLAQGRAIFNGCTTVWLRERYGADAVRHHMGHGWYLVNTNQLPLLPKESI